MNAARCSASSRLGIVTTSPYQIALFLRTHLKALPPDMQPIIFTNAKDPYRDLVADLEVQHVPISRAHHITPADIVSGERIRRQLLTAGVNMVVTMSPKGGFIGQLGARAAGIDRRLHIFTGQVWEGMSTGPKRLAVITADRVIGRVATHLAADSPSQIPNLKRWRITPPDKTVSVPHPPGSIRGVDLEVFRARPAVRANLRAHHGLGVDTVAFAHLGRISTAKGIPELVEAFRRVRQAWRNSTLPREPRLFLIGRDEGDLTSRLRGCDGIDILPFTTQPEKILAAMDVLVLASHREGFGSTIIEAAAMGLPAIGTDIIGVRDAIVGGETGWLVPRRSPVALQAVLAAVMRDHEEIACRGAAARRRALGDFEAGQVTDAWANYLMAIHRGDI